VTGELGYFTELDFTSPDFPLIRSAPRYISEGSNNEKDIGLAIQQMGFIADHPMMRKVIEMIAILAPIDRSILILGDTGTGKEITAKLIHRFSQRSAQPFVAVNCGAIPRDLVESILFGHRKGSFTGAVSDHPGKFREAHKGTLFLDELGELPEATQVKLLRVLQTGEIEPIGETKSVKVDVRLIAATNADLIKRIGNGKFREDLYHRVAKSVIRLPSLAERRTDIPKIALLVLDRINHQLKKSKKISPEALMKLQMYSWPGNVRELENVVENAAILSRNFVIGENDIELSVLPNNTVQLQLPLPQPGFSIEKYLSEIRRQLIEKALELGLGKQREAARLLGISPQAINKHLKK
jgi:two-component system response regulator HydG